MTQFSFSEEELRKAAIIVCDAIADSLPDPSEIKFALSESFIRRMDVLCSKAKQKERFHNMLMRIAAFLLAVLITLSTWLAFDTNARAALFHWVREVYENHIIYRFFGRTTINGFPIYTVTWLPDSFAPVTDDVSQVRRTIFYESNITDDAIVFDYYLLDEGFQTHYMNDYGECESVAINGFSGDYYPASGNSITNSLIWIDEQSGIVFHLDSTLNKSVILHIAESVDLCKLTK